MHFLQTFFPHLKQLTEHFEHVLHKLHLGHKGASVALQSSVEQFVGAQGPACGMKGAACGVVLSIIKPSCGFIIDIVTHKMSVPRKARTTTPTPRGVLQVLEDPFTWIDASTIALSTGALALYVVPLGMSARETVMVMATVFAASVASKVILATTFGLDLVEKLDSKIGLGFLE